MRYYPRLIGYSEEIGWGSSAIQLRKGHEGSPWAWIRLRSGRGQVLCVS